MNDQISSADQKDTVSLESDIIGQVARLPLKPSEANALLPLFEAISNSLYAIQERFGDDGINKNGRIDVTVLRKLDDGGISVIDGFQIRDNGIGLNKANYKSFRTPFSQHKMTKGGKGVGRLGWLKVFGKIHIDSCYDDKEKRKYRSFDFILREPLNKSLFEVSNSILCSFCLCLG
jgi:hypothetical protein